MAVRKCNKTKEDFSIEEYYSRHWKDRTINDGIAWKVDTKRLKKWMNDKGYGTRPLGSWI